MTHRIPRAVCPLRDEYIYVGRVLEKYDVYNMTINEFIGTVLKEAGGCMNPNVLHLIYDELMYEAGLDRKV